ncbi:MAG TPA: glycogen/starch/alpha-glucan phosphorylase, partial [Polyangiaceae bacterium]|nr:glycogen/starch/alpha-glucan phosphorylase [Polyangiaceae bacterium]
MSADPAELAPPGAAQEVAADIRRHARYSLCRPIESLTLPDLFTAVALSVRDRLVDGLFATDQRLRERRPKTLNYLSIEYLVGRSLGANLDSLGLRPAYREALRQLGADLAEVEGAEPDAALGNGGLGRLAACFLESLATLGMPAWGYGINYEYGLFKQEIDDGQQREKPDNWLVHASPWQLERYDEACSIPVYGRVEHGLDRSGGYNPMWLDWQLLVGVPHDMLVAGYGGRSVQRLRLYTARSSQSFDMQIFNSGDYIKAVERKIESENVSKVLYPLDAGPAGKELRLLQEYFLVACAMRDIIRRYERDHSTLDDLPNRVAVQLNDTHPALAIVEMMRILVDEKALDWVVAWELTRATFGFTNHTLAAEALERWPVALLEHMLPRHLQLIYEINRRLLQRVSARYPGDAARLARTSLIEESTYPDVRMSHVAMAGCHAINGVSELHSKLVQSELAADFHELWPEAFTNVTNGVSQRRWLLQANPALAELITRRLGSAWLTSLEALRELEGCADDPEFQREFAQVKRANKRRLSAFIESTLRVSVDVESVFDVHIKRFHAYKRQLLKVLHIIHDYLALIDGGPAPALPRTYIFAGKAAPGYQRAKQVIKLVNNIARIINADRRAHDHMRVIFLPDYRVSLAELIIPAADIGEQISTAGTEASGTSNMKLALNGAIGVCTADGANLELLEAVGPANLFMFGLQCAEARALRQSGYRPELYRDSDATVRRLLDALASDLFAPGQPGLFDWAARTLLDPRDEHVHLADLPSYLDAQHRASGAYADRPGWTRRAILNVARSGRFSSDRAVQEYARDI